MYTKIRNVTRHIMTSFCNLVLIGIVVLVNVSVIARYIFNNSLGWTEELSRYLQVWLTFLGVPLVFLYFSHIYINYVQEALKGKAKLMLHFVINGIIVFISYYMFFNGIELVVLNWNRRSATMDIPLGIVLYLVLPISAVLIFMSMVLNSIELIKGSAINEVQEGDASKSES